MKWQIPDWCRVDMYCVTSVWRIIQRKVIMLMRWDYVDEMPCPECRPEFLFINTMKEVVLEDEASSRDSQNGPVCSTESCTTSAEKYCTQGCQFMCQQYYDDHQSIGITRADKVIPSSEAESTKPPYPPCKRHKDQLMDLYCQTCHLPVLVQALPESPVYISLCIDYDIWFEYRIPLAAIFY